MADAFTTSLLLRKPEAGANQNAWAPLANEDFGSDRLEQAITGVESYALTADKTLTRANGETDQARMRIQNITSNTATWAIAIPAVPIWYWVRNGGANDLSITNGSNSVTVKAGNGVPVISDGTNIYQLRCIDYGADLPRSTGTPANSTDLVTKAYADGLAFSSALPAQSVGFLKSDGVTASWGSITSANVTTALGYTPTSVTGATGSLSAAAFKSAVSLDLVENKSSATIRGEFAAAANTFAAKQTFMASGSGAAGVNLPTGAAPSSPVAGDFWTTTAGTFFYDGTRTINLGQWTQIGSPLTTTGAASFAFSNIPAVFGDLMLLFQGVSPASTVNYQLEISDDGSNWATEIIASSVGASDTVYGAVIIPGYRRATGIFTFGLGVLSNRQIAATVLGGGVRNWRIDAGIAHAKLTSSAVNLDAGTLTLFGR